MNTRSFGMVIFISVFFLSYLGLHFYVLYRLADLLSIEKNIYFYLTLISLSISFILFSILERRFSNFTTKFLYTISAIWMGILFLLFSSLIVFELLNLFLNLPPFTSGWVIIILVGLITIYSLINAFFVRTKNLEIPIKNLKNELKIVQISDIHLGTIRGEGYLKSLTHKINRLHPDFVVITGDLFDGTAPLDNKIFKHVDDLNVPVYFVTGNHETYEGLDNVFEILKTTKLKILLNEVTKFRDLQIIGVSYSDKRNYLKKALKEIKFNKTKPTILLYHIPVNPKLLNDSGIQLHLGGHTHGGQIFPFNLMVKLYFPHSRGLKKFKESYSYISQGTGTWGPPMRLGSKNEITLIKLKKN